VLSLLGLGDAGHVAVQPSSKYNAKSIEHIGINGLWKYSTRICHICDKGFAVLCAGQCDALESACRKVGVFLPMTSALVVSPNYEKI
jgi:hypothetical protein